MTVYTFNPLDDGRWAEFVDRHPSASVFHTPEWVSALQQTYGYQPFVYTTSPPEVPLHNGILLCHVRSWVTGRRLVSVPFADHCEPLVSAPEERAAILAALRAAAGGSKYVELRPISSRPWEDLGLIATNAFALHGLDLRGSAADLYRGLQASAIQRKIRRAEREGVSCTEGRSEALLRAFYRLTLLTRRRHGIPPQPIEWFRNLIGCFGDRLTIREASRDGLEIGSILTLQHGKTLVYKYGCSDARFHHLGTMPFLFWTAIQHAKAAGVETFDLGRSDFDNPGLTTFKDRLGATAVTLTYLGSHRPRHPQARWAARVPKRIVSGLPDRLFVAAGELLYKHLG